MEVDRISFPHHLLGVLTALSDSHFVALDLEFSGISSKLANSGGKQTLEDRYQETKAAAEKYQILQFGITCVHQDPHTDVYTVRPYNFNLSPLVEDQLGIERVFAFQSGACQFLLRHGFRMDLPFTHGVGYLSRDEAQLAKKVAYDRLDKNKIQDIILKDHEIQLIDFVENVRNAILMWLERGMRPGLYINSDTGKRIHPEFQKISNLEKRLVHQLVRAEFPELSTISKPDHIRIVPLDVQKEADFRIQRKKKIKEQIDAETGFRWVVEAMTGGDLSRLDPLFFARNPAGDVEFVDLRAIKDKFFRAREGLRKKPRVLVGHNMFTDLIYFYRSFIGALPNTVDEFQRMIHKLFPIIVDTKYLATHNCDVGGINPRSSLEEIEEQLRLQQIPAIHIHKAHTKYVPGTDSFHEAGYDSLLTANVMIRLSAKLENEGMYAEEVSHSEDEVRYETAPEDNGEISLNGDYTSSVNEAWSPKHHTVSEETILGPVSPSNDMPVGSSPLIPSSIGPSAKSNRRKRGKKNKGATGRANDEAASRFATATMFDELKLTESQDIKSLAEWNGNEAEWLYAKEVFGELGWNDNFWNDYQQDKEAQAKWKLLREARHPPVSGSGSPSWDIDESAQHAKGPYALPEIEHKAPMVLMPPFASDFWRVYGNKLRVFGTEEGVLELTG